LKPANLLLDDRRRLKIADFGIAHTLADSVTRVTRINRPTSGTPAYMSPQQASGKRSSVSDDIYALGATLYDLLTGKPPYLTRHYSVLLNQLLDPNTAPPRVAVRRRELRDVESPIPESWEEVIAACLSKDCDARPTSASEVAARLLDKSSSALRIASAEMENPSPSSLTAEVALPHPESTRLEADPTLAATAKQTDEGPGPDPPPRKRGCTITFAITFGLTAMLGAYFVQESLERERAVRREAGIPSAVPPQPDAQSAVPAPVQEHPEVPTPVPQLEPPPESRPQPTPEPPPQRTAESTVRQTAPVVPTATPVTPRPTSASTPPRNLPTPRKVLSVPKRPYTALPGDGGSESEPVSRPPPGRSKGGVTAPSAGFSAAEKRDRAIILAREGAAAFPKDLVKAKAKAEEALRLWPECPQAKDLLRRVGEELAHYPRATPLPAQLPASPTPRPVNVPGD
jgi:serine/threonine protein kinase